MHAFTESGTSPPRLTSALRTSHHNSIPLGERFWSKVCKTRTCWLWLAGTFSDGYGMTSARIDGRKKTLKAHRVSWELTHGPIPEGMCVLHHCDVRNCVHPDHLFLGTNVENIADRDRKGRAARGERSGVRRHPESVQRGEAHHKAKLTEADVLAIRRACARGNITQAALAIRFDISKEQVGSIVHGKSWAHVGGPITKAHKGAREVA